MKDLRHENKTALLDELELNGELKQYMYFFTEKLCDKVNLSLILLNKYKFTKDQFNRLYEEGQRIFVKKVEVLTL